MLFIWRSGLETQIISYLFLSVSEPSKPFYTENMQYRLNEHLSSCHRCFFCTEQNNCGVTLLCSSSKKGVTSRVGIWRDGLHASGKRNVAATTICCPCCVLVDLVLCLEGMELLDLVLSPRFADIFFLFFSATDFDSVLLLLPLLALSIYTTDVPWTGCVNIYRLKRSLDKRKVSGSLPSWHKVCREDTGHLPAH